MLAEVKWYSKDKGYGFLTPEDGGPDIFLHRSQVEKAKIHSLEPGTQLEFDCEPSKTGKGNSAVNIKIISTIE